MRDKPRIFEKFLEADSPIYNYKDDIHRMLRSKQTRLIVNIDDLRDFDRESVTGLLKNPVDCFPAFEAALKSVIEHVYDQEKHGISSQNFHVGFSGSFGDYHVSPRTLCASHLGKMISLEGIITRCSLVRPKMLKSVHYCPETGQFHEREYRDATSSTSSAPPTTSLLPATDD